MSLLAPAGDKSGEQAHDSKGTALTKAPEVQYAAPRADSPLALALLVFWGLAGPLSLYLLAARMLREGSPSLSVSSLVYFGVLGLSIALRYVDVEFFKGCTLTGRRATSRDWRAYSLVLGVSALLLWAMVQVLNGAITYEFRGRNTLPPLVTLEWAGHA